MSNLTKFLFSLYNNEDLQSRFNQDPEKAMEKAGLSHDQKEAIISKDNDRISRAVSEENKMSATGTEAFTIGIFITIKF